MFAVFANFAFTFHALFASFAFHAYRIYLKILSHIARFWLSNFFWEETMLSVPVLNRAEVSLQNLHACVHARNKTESFLVPKANVLFI